MAGLWTPVTGIIVSAVQGWIAFSLPNGTLMPIVLAVLGLSSCNDRTRGMVHRWASFLQKTDYYRF